MRLDDKTYIVANATSPLGSDLSKHLAGAGANLILTSLDHVELDDLLEEIKADSTGHHSAVLLQQSKEIDWLNVLSEIEKDFDSLNGIILVHTIHTESKSIYDLSFDEFSEVVNEHIWGTYLGTKVLRPLLKDESEAKIINVIEPSFEEIYERNLYYTVTGAIEALTHSTAIELSREDVDVYALSYRPSFKESMDESLERSNPEAIGTVMDILSDSGTQPTGETIIIN